MCSYRLGDGPIKTSTPPEPCRAEIKAHYAAGCTFSAFNVSFERQIARDIAAPRYGWPEIPLRQWSCTNGANRSISLQLVEMIGLAVRSSSPNTAPSDEKQV
jgi:hypothetical protein